MPVDTRRAELQARVRVDLAIVPDPEGKQGEGGVGVGQDRHPNVVAFQRFEKASDMMFDSGLRTGVKSSVRPMAHSMSAVSLAMQALPLSDSHSMAYGSLVVPKRHAGLGHR